uniref:Band 7 protein AAEL010189 n=1 Tax=Lepeophtheirus salmonis TaxID=72036 RepID=D3PK25_LEPSM|nr:Band 7 protein AAEL010189 [Lepeophtheirus salmonis]
MQTGICNIFSCSSRSIESNDSDSCLNSPDNHTPSVQAQTVLPNVPVHIPQNPVESPCFVYLPENKMLGEIEWQRCMMETKQQASYRQVRFVKQLSGNEKMLENFLRLCACFIVFLALPFSLVFCLKVVTHYERAVLFRLGRLISTSAKGPGLIFVLPCLDRFRLVDLRTFTFDVPTQEVLTKDSVTVAVNAVVYYRIRDPVKAIVNVEDANRSTRLLGQTTLRNVLGTVSLDQLLTSRDNIAALMQECLDSVTEAWGVKVERVEIKDVRLPIQLQRAMAAEAEATREATAKVIAAEGEMHASGVLRLAAVEIMQHPIALQLRYLQTVSNICFGKKFTIFFPIVMQMLELFSKKQESKKNEDVFDKPEVSDENNSKNNSENESLDDLDGINV